MELRRFLVLLTLALVFALIIAVWFFPSNEDFRVENPFWNGTRHISTSYPVLPMESLSELPKSANGTTLILVPYLMDRPKRYRLIGSIEVQGFNTNIKGGETKWN